MVFARFSLSAVSLESASREGCERSLLVALTALEGFRDDWLGDFPLERDPPGDFVPSSVAKRPVVILLEVSECTGAGLSVSESISKGKLRAEARYASRWAREEMVLRGEPTTSLGTDWASFSTRGDEVRGGWAKAGVGFGFVDGLRESGGGDGRGNELL